MDRMPIAAHLLGPSPTVRDGLIYLGKVGQP
jgi:hypothetical protein